MGNPVFLLNTSDKAPCHEHKIVKEKQEKDFHIQWVLRSKKVTHPEMLIMQTPSAKL